MPVDTPNAEYDQHLSGWRRMRDALYGEDAVSARATTYLRRPQSMSIVDFGEYAKAATWFPATSRTREGLTGAVFRKDPIIKAPDGLIDNVDGRGTPLVAFAKGIVSEVIGVGRYGVIADVGDEGAPYLAGYRTENIINWRETTVEGAPKLTMVVLREFGIKVDPTDRFKEDAVEQYRVLELVTVPNRDAPVYTVSVFEKDPSRRLGEQMTLVSGPIVPTRRGQPLDFIPFYFFGPTSLTPSIETPPLAGLAELNFSHYRSGAEYENSLWHAGFPIFVVSGSLSGVADGGDTSLRAGSSLVWQLEKDGKAVVLQGAAENVGALRQAIEDKERRMAVLGARMLEPQRTGNPEHHETVSLRHRGEDSILASISDTVSRGLTRALKTMAWWAGKTGEVSVELNRDFLPTGLTGKEVTHWVAAWLQNGIGLETLHYNLARGEALPTGWDFQRFADDIETQGPGSVFLSEQELDDGRS